MFGELWRRKHPKWDEFCAKGYNDLATYNAERRRGIVHEPEYDAWMAEIQERFDAEREEEAIRLGHILVR